MSIYLVNGLVACLPAGSHEIRIIHEGTRIVIRTSNSEVEDSANNVIQMWQSCAICDAQTPRTNMHNGALYVFPSMIHSFLFFLKVICSLFSFAKFLELLVYSPTIYTLNSSLCDHTTPPSLDLPATRLNIIRHFSTTSSNVSFALSTTEDTFELKVPRLQIMRGGNEKANVSSLLGHKEEWTEDEASQKKDLR